MDTKPWYLKYTDFSEQLSPEDKMVFMRICPEKRYQKGDHIYRLGDPATHLHVIARGQVKLVKATPAGQERILAILGPDDFMGEAFLKEESYYRVDAVALTEVVTCPISRSQFMELALLSPRFVLSFAEILTSHLFSCRDQLSHAYDSVKTRVATLLLEQARRFGKSRDGVWCELSTELRHEEIASHISATRVSVSTSFAQLRNEGFIEGTRGFYRLNIPALLAVSEQE